MNVEKRLACTISPEEMDESVLKLAKIWHLKIIGRECILTDLVLVTLTFFAR